MSYEADTRVTAATGYLALWRRWASGSVLVPVSAVTSWRASSSGHMAAVVTARVAAAECDPRPPRHLNIAARPRHAARTTPAPGCH